MLYRRLRQVVLAIHALESLHIILALAATRDLDVMQFDINSAY